MNTVTNKKTTILYCRLSVDDGSAESNSISHQREMLIEYAERGGFTPYSVEIDDGFTGTNYSRPGWQNIMARIDADEVSTLIVKNLDRMGRNYLQNGLYREMFQERGIRLICINDGIDTLNSEGDDFIPFREIMAEWFARDTSRKIKAVFASKARSGKPVTGHPPYGFIKDPQDKTKWLVDEPAASVVRRIYQMTIDGIGVGQIARKLSEEKVERPSYYLGVRGLGRHKNDYDAENRYAWGTASIKNILNHMEYCGHTVNLRSTIANFKSKKSQKKPESEWLIFENTHEAIVSQEDFDLVQKLRETPRRIDTLGAANPLTGLLFCADCGAKLYNHRKAHTEKPTHTKLTDVYHCSTYKLGRQKFNATCTAHNISSEAVREIILTVLRKTAGYVREYEQEFVELVRESAAVRQNDTAKTYKKQISKNERRLADLTKICKSLYEDKALNKISEEMYAEMVSGYNDERSDLQTKTAALKTELDEYNADGERADKFIEIVRRYTEFRELTPEILNTFIDKVIVHEAEWSEGRNANNRPIGARSQRVDVYLKYIGNFDAPDTRTSEEIEAERIAEEKLAANRAYHREKTRQSSERKRQREAAEQTAAAV
ncbi:recombinase [Clostridia bacterium]|nr:recombinase [Clostridia bacterium]